MDRDNFIAHYKYAILKALLNTSSSRVNVSFNGYKVFNETRSRFGISTHYDPNNGFLFNILKTIVLENNEDSIRNIVKEISSVTSRDLKDYVLRNPYIFDWKCLSKNFSIEWKPEEIYKFSEFLDFKELSFNPNVCFNTKLIEDFGEYWDWVGISGNPAVFKGCGEYILNHPAVIFKPELNPDRTWPGIQLGKELLKVNNIYWGQPRADQTYLPSISSNSGITWTKELVINHFDKIDFWTASLLSKIKSEAFYILRDKLNENREFETIYTKYSDWRDEYNANRNGWQNLMKNGKIICDIAIIDQLGDFEITIIEYDGDAKSGHTKKEINLPLRSFLIPQSFQDLSFYDLINQSHIISTDVLNEYYIDQILFEDVIFPEFVKNPTLVERLFWSL